jgi:hypothetical protein
VNNLIEDAERDDIIMVFKDIEKFKADGTHEKFKSQLDAHGNEQDTMLYPDRASPTAQLHSIMTCLAVAVCKEQCTVGKLDVKGAFIQTEMSGTPVYIKCMGGLKDMILCTFPEYIKSLGIQLEFEKGSVKIDMSSYIGKMLGDFINLKHYQGLENKT